MDLEIQEVAAYTRLPLEHREETHSVHSTGEGTIPEKQQPIKSSE
jgi:hypothetical protein